MNAISHAPGAARPTGLARIVVERVCGASAVTAAFASSPMKLLTPVARGNSVWACTSSFGGGLVAGDETDLQVRLGPGARCFLSTQSSTKIYRNPGRLPCSHRTHAKLEVDSLLVFSPEPVQAFADSRYRQRQEFHLAHGAGLVLLDWFTSGRAARGERWDFAWLESRNDLFLDGARAVLDSVRLSSEDLSQRMGRFNCLATLLVIGAPLRDAAAAWLGDVGARPVERRAPLAISASPIRDGALLRIAGESVESVRHEIQRQLTFLREHLGGDPWSRKW